MITNQLINPTGIVVVGGSSNLTKPGGKLLKNIIDSGYTGKLYVVNPKESQVLGVPCYSDVSELPSVDMAVLAIPAKNCPHVVEILAQTKNCRAFVVISAGFAEESVEGALLEQQMAESVKK